MKQQNKKFLLVAIGLGQNKVVKEGTVEIVQSEKSKLKKLPQWKGYKFEVRTPEGYAAVKVLPKKIKK